MHYDSLSILHIMIAYLCLSMIYINLHIKSIQAAGLFIDKHEANINTAYTIEISNLICPDTMDTRQ